MSLGFGNFTVGNCYPAIQQYLAGRIIDSATMADWVTKAVLELSGDYWFQGLQNTGPYFYFTPGTYSYAQTNFLQPADTTSEIRKVASFFMYYQAGLASPPPPNLVGGGVNAGVVLKYRSMDSIENSLNTQAIPAYWGRFSGLVYIAPCPNQNYLSYMRYQKAHPFPNAGTVNAGNDTIYLDDDWQEIVEYAAAYRGAISIRLMDYAAQYRQVLYGDPKAVDAGGRRIDLGLIYSRTAQYERDVTTSVRSLKIRRR